MTTGIQGIVPALPTVQSALQLSDAQVSLITSIYLLPSVIFAFPAGVLTERVGRRAMFTGAMIVFAAAAAPLFVTHSFAVILVMRGVQGVAFGAILSLTVTIIGDFIALAEQASAQGRRVIAVAAGEATFSAVGGALAAAGWTVPFAMQFLALPVALWGWTVIPPDRDATRSARPHVATISRSLRNRLVQAIQVLSFLRFFSKFSLLTFFPLLATQRLEFSEFDVGVTLGAASALGAIAAGLTGRVLRRAQPSAVLAASVGITSASFVVIALVSVGPLVACFVMFFGIADGVFGVTLNVVVTSAAPRGSRAAFVALAGTVRNIGKLAAPVVGGALAILISVPGILVVAASVGAVMGVTTRSLDTAPRLEGTSGDDAVRS